MELGAGSTLLHYRIASFLGRGGMGAVYRAEDTKLGRDVAVKLLPAEFADNDDRLSRFDREARLLAALNHPHIATIHGIENVDGMRFIVMEYVTGETLADRLSNRGAMPVDESIAVARQIAAAIEAAHDKGVIHRDLKPGNIIIDDEGRVKVLDFGLAANIGQDSVETEILKSPTIPRQGTHTGVILGTAGYMSPEQARGKKVDRRADVWAFGVVLFEMLSGRRLFFGETVSDTLAAVLKEEPNWDALPPDTPSTIRRLLHRCLAKRAADRMRDFGDIRLELSETEDVVAPPPHIENARPSFVPWVIAAIALAIAGYALWRAAPKHPVPLTKTVVTTDLENAWNIVPAISPDGRRVAYAASGALWIRSLDELEPRKIPLVGARQPVLFWSPDSKWVVFISDEKMWKIAPGGTAPVTIAPLPHNAGVGTRMRFHSGAWGADDRIVLAVFKGGLYEISARGGSASELMPPSPELVDFHNISFLPDGKTLLGVPHGMKDRTTVEVIRGKERKVVATFPRSVVRGAAYSSTGHLLVSVAGTDAGVWAVPFSVDKLATTGSPFRVLAGAGGCTASDDGSLVYVANIDDTPRQLVHVDRKGKLISVIGEPIDSAANPVISNDQRSVAVTTRDSENNVSVSVIDLATGVARQVTRGFSISFTQMFLKDDRSLLVHRDTGNWSDPQTGIWIVPIDGSAQPRVVAHGFSGNLTPDGRNVVYLEVVPRDNANIATIPLAPGAKPVDVVRSPYPKMSAVLSPDGRLVAYTTIESEFAELFVTRYPTGDTRWQVSQGGASNAVWSADGQTLYFGSHNKLMSVAPTPGAQPAVVFDPAPLDISIANGYAVMRDGSVIAVQDLANTKRQVVLVQNWIAEFR